jgi:hypothetical protein
MKHLPFVLALLLCSGTGAVGASAQPHPGTSVVVPREPVLSGHSHNDFLRPRPLWDALALGLNSIEVDVYLVGGALLVGHDEVDLDPTRTLQALYLDPLRDHVGRNGGWVYGHERSLDLLIDIKSDARSTYEELVRVLARYSEMVTTYSASDVQARAVSVIVSGNRPRRFMLSQRARAASYDGRLEDLNARVPANFVSMVSDDWERHFEWRGSGPLSDRDARRLSERVEDAHQRGYRLRFWNVPVPADRPMDEVWDELLRAGVDLLSIDDLGVFGQYLSRVTASSVPTPALGVGGN